MVLFVLVWCPVNFVDVDFFIADPTNSIDAAALLSAALSRQLITEPQRVDCFSEPDPNKKAEKFLGYLQRAVNGDSKKFHIFVQLLNESGQESIASRLKTQGKI